jgi:hypothetical protein
VDARDRRQDEGEREHRDDRDRDAVGRLDAPQEIESAVDLKRPEPERRRAPEQRREDRKDVDRLADRAVDAVTQERIERGADQVRQAAPEGEVGERQANDRVDGPRMQRPVEVGQRHGLLGRRFGSRLYRSGRRSCHVRDRLGDCEEHQADPHPGAEHHRDPRHGAELGPVVVLPQAHPPEPGERQDGGEDEERHRGQDEDPAEGRDDPTEHIVGHRRDALAVEHAPEDESSRDGRGDSEDHRVDPGPLRLV